LHQGVSFQVANPVLHIIIYFYTIINILSRLNGIETWGTHYQSIHQISKVRGTHLTLALSDFT